MLRLAAITSLLLLASLAVFAQAPKPRAEAFEVADMKGETVSLEALRGKVVVLTFWSTRCVICHGEIPKLNQMASAFKGKNVVFLAVTMENPNKVEAYVKDRPFDFEIIPNGFGVLLKYATKDESGTLNMPYPTFFIIGPDGEVEMKTEGTGKTPKMSSMIDSLLTSTGRSL